MKLRTTNVRYRDLIMFHAVSMKHGSGFDLWVVRSSVKKLFLGSQSCSTVYEARKKCALVLHVIGPFETPKTEVRGVLYDTTLGKIFVPDGYKVDFVIR